MPPKTPEADDPAAEGEDDDGTPTVPVAPAVAGVSHGTDGPAATADGTVTTGAPAGDPAGAGAPPAAPPHARRKFFREAP